MDTDICYEKGLVSDKVRTARKKRELTQNELAKRVGCKASNIASIENGFGMPSAKILIRLMKVLDFSF